MQISKPIGYLLVVILASIGFYLAVSIYQTVNPPQTDLERLAEEWKNRE